MRDASVFTMAVGRCLWSKKTHCKKFLLQNLVLLFGSRENLQATKLQTSYLSQLNHVEIINNLRKKWPPPVPVDVACRFTQVVVADFDETAHPRRDNDLFSKYPVRAMLELSCGVSVFKSRMIKISYCATQRVFVRDKLYLGEQEESSVLFTALPFPTLTAWHVHCVSSTHGPVP